MPDRVFNVVFFFQAEDGIRDAQESRGLGDVYKRQVWKDDNGRIIDLHCFEYVEDGILYDGYTFPSETFSGKGKIGNIEVFCINPEAQVQFHLGYEYDENDVHDVLLLCRTFNLEIPEQYKTHI